MFKASLLAAVAIAWPVALAPAVWAQEGGSGQDGADRVIARVNDQPITLGQMIVMRQSLADPNAQSLPDQALWDLMLDQLIRQAAVAGAAEENAGVRAQIELQRRNTLATATVSQLAEGDASEEEIAAAYDRLFQDVPETTEYNAAHILVETEEDAREIKAKLDEGAEFGDMAEQRSTGPSGPNRGDLGWFSADQMVAPFAEAVAAMEPGQISDPVETEFGWHLIQLNDTRTRAAPGLDEVRDQLAQMVLREKVEAEINRLVSEARIERVENVDPAQMRDTNLLEAQ